MRFFILALMVKLVVGGKPTDDCDVLKVNDVTPSLYGLCRAWFAKKCNEERRLLRRGRDSGTNPSCDKILENYNNHRNDEQDPPMPGTCLPTGTCLATEEDIRQNITEATDPLELTLCPGDIQVSQMALRFEDFDNVTIRCECGQTCVLRSDSDPDDSATWHRVLEFVDVQQVSLSGLHIMNGKSPNRYNPDGGNVYFKGFSLYMKNCDLEGGVALHQYQDYWGEWRTTGSGGNLYAFGSNDGTVELRSCQFRDGVAADSGGMSAVFFTSFLLNDTDFVNNTAYWHSGGLLASHCGSVTLDGCIFRQNHAQHQFGGGFSSRYAPITVSHTLFEANTAGHSAALGRVWGDSLNDVTIRPGNSASGHAVGSYGCADQIFYTCGQSTCSECINIA